MLTKLLKVTKAITMTKGNPVQSDPLQFMRIIIGKLHQNLLELERSCKDQATDKST